MKVLRILKGNLLILSAIAAFFFLLSELNDPTPLGNAREILATTICGAWLMIFGYAQITR